MSAPNYRSGGAEGRPTPKDRWRTPLDFFNAMHERFMFDLDAACETGNKLVDRGLCRDEGHDGLSEPWDGRAVWCNPPYSRVEPWLEKAATESRIRGCTAVLLIPADTSTGWWGRWIATRATRVEFVSQRIRFRDPSGDDHRTKNGGGGLTTPSAVVIFTSAGGPPSYGYVNRKGERVRFREEPDQVGLNLAPASKIGGAS